MCRIFLFSFVFVLFHFQSMFSDMESTQDDGCPSAVLCHTGQEKSKRFALIWSQDCYCQSVFSSVYHFNEADVWASVFLRQFD